MKGFERFASVYGPGIECRPVNAGSISKHKAVLPSILMDHWSQCGWCGYGDGLIWVVEPDDLQEPLIEWIGSERAASSRVVVRTAFGDLIFWNEKGAHYLDVHRDLVFEMTTDLEIVFEFSLCDDDYLDRAMGRKLFIQAKERLGGLTSDECYAFLPAIAAGGAGTVDTLQRVKLREQLSILAQMRDASET